MEKEDLFEVKEVLTAKQVAERLKIKKSYVDQHATLFVGYFKIGGTPRFDWNEIQHAIKMKKNLVQKMKR